MKQQRIKKSVGFFPLICALFLLFVLSLFFWIGLLLFLMGCHRTENFAPLADKENSTNYSQSAMVNACSYFSPKALNNSFADASGSDLQSRATSASALQTALAEQVLRLHIIADSNSDADQKIKLSIRDAVITYLKPYLEDVTTKQEAIEIINAHLGEINDTANRILSAQGFSYTANAGIERVYFPIKLYGDLVLPAGEYDAIRIRLGSASGKNWWCLIFPQLCFVDVTTGTLPEDSKAELRELLTEEEYALIFPEEALLASTDASINFFEQTCKILFDYAPKQKKPEILFPLLRRIKDLFS